MRALLGLIVLGGLFLLAAGWQKGQSDAQRARREQRHGLPDPRQPRDGDWSLLVLGASSGAEPIEGYDPPAGPGSSAPPGPSGPLTPDPPPYAPDYRYEVQPGDHLGGICDRHYGTSRPALVEAVSRYNELPDPDAIGAGDSLLLPDRALLRE